MHHTLLFDDRDAAERDLPQRVRPDLGFVDSILTAVDGAAKDVFVIKSRSFRDHMLCTDGVFRPDVIPRPKRSA